MLLAGGALAIAGCPGTTESDLDASAPSDAGSDVSPFCCNKVADPCCRFEHCGDPMSAECACSLDGGTFVSAVLVEAGPLVTECVFDAGDVDDANPDDAGADADTD